MINSDEIVGKIKEGINKGYKSVFFDTADEGLYFEILRKIHRIIKMLNVQDINFYYLTSCLNGPDVYKDYCLEHNITPLLKMLAVNQFENVAKDQLNFFYIKTNRSEIEYKKGLKEKLFVCFNKNLRGHRTKIFHKILKHGLLEKSYSSFEYGKNVISVLKYQDPENMLPAFEKYQHLFPLTLNVTSDRTNPIDVRDGDLIYHDNSYFSLITETLFFKNEMDVRNGIFLTEKTFRTIGLKHPFILLSPAGSLEYLKKVGYKTFAPFINESYDLEEDDNKRFELVWKEVQRLCSFTPYKWLSWQEKIVPIVEYNYNHFWNKNNYVVV